jgi:hypothetical protein
MKAIPIRSEGDVTTVAIVRGVVEAAPNGINVAQMRSRIRILDALDKASEAILLEDADHAVLAEAVNGALWTKADRNVMRIIDDILEAGAPS